MGSVVTYRCEPCSFSSGHLSVGWSKGHRAELRGGLALCARCERLIVVNFAEPLSTREEWRCVGCGGPLTLLGGAADSIPCPHCKRPLQRRIIGVGC